MHQESTFEKALVDKATRNHIPINGTFELLPICNMSCRMCFLKLSKEEMTTLGGLHSVEEWISVAQEMLQAGTFFILLTGGETFLYPGFKELYTKLRSMGFIITINTNATLLDEDMADFLAKDKPRRVNITLYGTNDQTYKKICGNPNGYTQTMHGIRLLKERGIAMRINVTLVPENVMDIERFHEIAKELQLPLEVNTYLFPVCRERNVPFAQEMRLEPEVAAEAYMKMLELQLGSNIKQYVRRRLYEMELYNQNHITTDVRSKMPCRAGRSVAWISWRGDLIPCGLMSEPAINIFSNGFIKSWEQYSEMINELELSLECTNCEMRPLCTACAAFAKSDEGEVWKKPQYMCKYTTRIIEIMKSLVDIK